MSAPAEMFAWVLVFIHIVGGVLQWIQASSGGRTQYQAPAALRMTAMLSFTLAFCCWFYFT